MYHASVFDVYDTKENHLLYEYFDHITAGAKNMYNVANFNIRQLMTGLKKESSSRTPNEQNVIDRFEKLVPAVNKRRSGRNMLIPVQDCLPDIDNLTLDDVKSLDAIFNDPAVAKAIACIDDYIYATFITNRGDWYED